MSLILSGTDGLSDIDGSAATPAIRGTDANTGIFFGTDIIGFSEGGAEVARFNADAQFVAAAGTASLPVITTTGDANTGIFFPAADTIAFSEGGVEAMRIDSSGNVGIGTSSPSTKLDVSGVVNSAGFTCVGNYSANRANATAYNVAGGIQLQIDGTTYAAVRQPAAEVLAFYRGNGGTNETMRITAGGVLMVGNSTFTNAGLDAGAAYINSNLFIGNSAGTAAYNVRIDGFSNALYVAWNNGTVDINSISYAYGGTAWVQTSDETLKDIIEPITDAANKVSTLRAVIGKFKTEEEGIRHPFLIAQDVQAVLPEAVYVNKSRVEGDPDTLGIGYTDVIPLLVAAIKEQQALILSLTTRISALETP
jgi:hypothetical protein